jgi:anti-anti-sigma regulatory factor
MSDAQSEELPMMVDHIGDVAVLRFSEPILLTGRRADAVDSKSKDLLTTKDQKVLLDFTKVGSVNSQMLCKLLGLNRIADGRFALCNLNERISQILDTTKLATILTVYDSEAEALAEMSGEKSS